MMPDGLRSAVFYAGLASVMVFWVVASVSSIPGGLHAASHLGLPELAGAAFAIVGILTATLLAVGALDVVGHLGGVSR